MPASPHGWAHPWATTARGAVRARSLSVEAGSSVTKSPGGFEGYDVAARPLPNLASDRLPSFLQKIGGLLADLRPAHAICRLLEEAHGVVDPLMPDHGDEERLARTELVCRRAQRVVFEPRIADPGSQSAGRPTCRGGCQRRGWEDQADDAPDQRSGAESAHAALVSGLVDLDAALLVLDDHRGLLDLDEPVAVGPLPRGEGVRRAVRRVEDGPYQ